MLQHSLSGHTFTLFIAGRVDTASVDSLQSEIDGAIGETQFDELVLDLEKTEYISSAGLRLLLMLQKKMNSQNKKMSVANPNKTVLDVFQLTGFSEIINVRQKMKQMDISKAEKIAGGLCAEVYRIDDDTVLKLYKKGLSEEMMYKEKDYAKKAFVLGIPTAISYDMVEADGRIGILFEMIKAKDLASTMRDDLDNIPKYAKMFSELAKLVHNSDGSKTDLPRKRDNYVKLLERCTMITPKERAVLQKMLDSIPVGTSVVHGDFHPANTMISNGELVFIDMGDLGVSEPYSDLAQVYCLYKLDENKDLLTSITKLDTEHRHEFYRYFIDNYFDHPTAKVLAEKEKLIRKHLAFRILFFLDNFHENDEGNLRNLRAIIAENA